MKLFKKCVVLMLAVIAMTGMTSAKVNAEISSNLSEEVLNSSSSSSSAVSLIGAVDENGEFLSMSTGVALSLEEGGVAIYTISNVYVDNAYAYVWITDSETYIAEYSASVDSLGMIEFLSEDGGNDPGALYVASPYQGEASTLVYMDGNEEIASANIVVQDMSYVDDFATISVDGIPGGDMYVPAAIIDVDGNCTGIVMNSSTIWAPALEEEYFYGSSDSSGTGGTGTGGSGSGDSGTGGSGSGGSGSGGSFLDNIGSGALMGGLVGVAVAVTGVILKNTKKKKGEQPVDQQIPEVSMAHQIPESVLQKVPVTPIYSEESNSSASAGGFHLRAIGGYMDGRVYPINNQEITFGRDTSCVVRFPADAKGVSRNHCKLFWKNGTLMLMDMNSSYGTYVEGGKLYPMQPVAIKFGDVFYIGEKNNQFKIQ